MEWQVIGLLMIAAVLFTVFLGMPIGFALVAVALAFLIPSLGFVKSTFTVATEVWGFWTSWSLLPILLFVLMAEFLFMGGAAKNIFDMAAKWLQRLPGGLAVVTTAACAVFASMCGSSGGAAAAMAVVAIPEMRKRGYSARLSGGCVAVSGCLAHLIPPSVLMVVYASLAEISPGRALIAGAIPGFLLAFLYILTTFVWVVVSPSSAKREMAVPFGEKVRSLKMIWQPAFIILAVMGSMLMGVATATEAAALGAVASLIIAWINRRVERRQFMEVIVETARMGCFILVVCIGGKTLSQTMTYYLIPQHFVEVIVAMNFSPYTFMVILMGVYLIMGCFLDPIGMMVITLPVVLPILDNLGFDLYWFGVMLMINFEMALITPPYGPVLYIVHGAVPSVSIKEIVQGSLLFFPAIILEIFILLSFPEIALWLPMRMLQ